MKIEVTKHQLDCIKEAGDILSSAIGGTDVDDDFRRIVNGIDRMLRKNGMKRDFK